MVNLCQECGRRARIRIATVAMYGYTITLDPPADVCLRCARKMLFREVYEEARIALRRREHGSHHSGSR